MEALAVIVDPNYKLTYLENTLGSREKQIYLGCLIKSIKLITVIFVSKLSNSSNLFFLHPFSPS